MPKNKRSNDLAPSGKPPEPDPVTAYAQVIASGVKPAGKWHRLACERHLRDLDICERKEGDYLWRPELAVKAIGMFGLFRHYKGEWAPDPITLEDWQQFIVGSLFGWVHRDTGFRRFTNAFCELARGQGKSTMAGGLLVLLTFFDNEPGAEGYVFATKKDQARIVFRAARQMVLKSKVLRERIGGILRHNLHNEATESKCEPLGSNEDTMDGLRPHIAIGDEIHQHANADLVEVIESGMGTRRQPLLFEITTAGESDAPTTVYGQHVSISQQVLERAIDLPSWFCFIAAADPEDDWTLEATWIKANPNWGRSVKPGFIRKEYQKALANPAEQPKFKRLYLGLKTDATDAYLSLHDWNLCPPLPPDDELRECPSWIGLDLSSSIDVTAAVHVWRLANDEIALRPFFWIPGDDLADRGRRDKVNYQEWVRTGHLRTTPGNTIDRPVIRRALGPVATEWDVRAICFDPWQAQELTQDMQDQDGLVLMPVNQRFAILSQPMKDLQALILRRRVRHDHNPVMAWMVSNMKARQDDREFVMPCKKRSRGRIDGVQALVTALTQVLIKVARSKYEDDSLWSIGGGIS